MGTVVFSKQDVNGLFVEDYIRQWINTHLVLYSEVCVGLNKIKLYYQYSFMLLKRRSKQCTSMALLGIFNSFWSAA